MKVSVLGCGRWGSFLAWYNNRIGNKTVSWGMVGEKSYDILKATRANEYVTFPPEIELTDDLGKAIAHAETIIISISAQGLRGFVKRIKKYDISGKTFVLCMKGIEESSGKRLSEVAIEEGIDRDDLAVWVGPGHIQSFVKGIPNCMVIDSYNPELTRRLADAFKSDLIRFYYGGDIIGTEVGAAAKNVMGIVAGMLDGMKLSELKGPLMARGSREVARLTKALGGSEFSAYGLCHLGDYETTLFSQYSHNRMWGESYARGEKFDRLAEGVPTAGALCVLADKYGVDMPITREVYEMICNHTPPKEALERLFDRSTKDEFYL